MKRGRKKWRKFSRKEARRVRREEKYFRKHKFNRHHITNKCRGGNASDENILRMDINRHNAWHFLFKNMDFLDVIRLLARCLKMKRHPDSEEAQSEIGGDDDNDL
jgi:hypothetical protein